MATEGGEPLLTGDLAVLARQAFQGDSASRAALRDGLARLVPKKGLTRERITAALVAEGWDRALAWGFSGEVLDAVSLRGAGGRGVNLPRKWLQWLPGATLALAMLLVVAGLVMGLVADINTLDDEFAGGVSLAFLLSIAVIYPLYLRFWLLPRLMAKEDTSGGSIAMLCCSSTLTPGIYAICAVALTGQAALALPFGAVGLAVFFLLRPSLRESLRSLGAE